MSDRKFNDGARKVMRFANQEAQGLKHGYLGSEHILIGLMREGTGVAYNVLRNFDVDLKKIRVEVEKLVNVSPDTATEEEPPQTPRARTIMTYTIEEANHLNHHYVGTEHILLALLRAAKPTDVGTTVLTNLGLKLEEIRKQILHLLGFELSQYHLMAEEKV